MELKIKAKRRASLLWLTLLCAGACNYDPASKVEPSNQVGSIMVELTGVESGKHLVVDSPPMKYYILKDSDNTLRVFAVPYDFQKNFFLMPDLTWTRAYIPCRDFDLRREKSTKRFRSPSEKYFSCRDTDRNRLWWVRQWIWNSEGKSLAETTTEKFESLLAPIWKLEGKSIVITPIQW